MSTPATNLRRDEAMEHTLARLLTTMMLIAAATILAGVVMLYFNRTPATGQLAPQLVPITTFSTFQENPTNHTSYRSLATIAQGLRNTSALALIQAGLVLLIATPVLRVAATAAIFAKNRDWLYVAISLIVLASLGAGLWGFVH